MHAVGALGVVCASLLASEALCEYAHEQALRARVPDAQHAAVDFLLEHMPERDHGLAPEFLAEHIEYAYLARERFSWAKELSDELFFNNVLPYASLNERREAWRKAFYEAFAPLVSECQTAGEAALILNAKGFEQVKVGYSREREKADQSSFESIASGKASCTGLSILLVDACRALGIPARVVGTPLWVDGSGNHTWAEIWDDGWRYLGACESKRLDRGWFAAKAAKQIEGDRYRAIYASSFQSTGTHFPLPWKPKARDVNAVDVTRRYARDASGRASLSAVDAILSKGPLLEVLNALVEKDQSFALNDFEAVKAKVWVRYAAEVRGRAARKTEDAEKAISYNGKTMRYAYQTVGEKPEEGYPLYIALHGGGGAPTRVNDQQWAHMQRYYLKGVTNGIYLATRGVTDTWNLHWVRESFACYDRIIENMIVFAGVNPNRVYLMGYSAGGDALYQIPARMADRWAAAAMSAGHPNGVPVDNYAALPFLIQVGARDSAYKRNTVAAEYGVKLAALRTAHPGYYEHETFIHVGRGHGVMDHDRAGRPQRVYSDPAEWLEKRDAASVTNRNANSIHWLDQHVRQALPAKVIWHRKALAERTGEREDGFWPTTEKGNLHYWLGVDRYDQDPDLDAERIVVELDRVENAVRVREVGNFVRVYLRPDMLDLSREVIVKVGGQSLKGTPRLSLRILVQTILDRGDPTYAFAASLTVHLNPENRWILE